MTDSRNPPDPVLTREGGPPLHHQLSLLLRDRIRSGLARPGEFLPSEDELARSYGVSRVTVRRSLTSLEAEGLIDRRQGIGTVVREAVAPPVLQASMADLVSHVRDVGSSTRATLLDYGFGRAPDPVRAAFGAGPEALFQRAVRLRSDARGPLLLVTTWLPEAVGRLVAREDLARRPLLELLERAGVRLAAGRQSVGAVLADPVTAGRLQVELGAPLLRIRRIHLGEDLAPVQYLELLASPDRFELHMDLPPEEA